MRSWFLLFVAMFLLNGCSIRGASTPEQRTFADLSYFETSTNRAENKKLASQFDGQYIKWTARVKGVKNYRLELGARDLAGISASFSSDVEKAGLTKGDVVSVSCVLRSYSYTSEQWSLRGCQLEPTTDSDRGALITWEQAREKADARLHVALRLSKRDYVGLEGFVVARSSDLRRLSNSQRLFPNAPWTVQVMQQVGDYKFDRTEEVVPHKARVRVVGQTIGGYPGYVGAVLVQLEDDGRRHVWVDHRNFEIDRYWEEPITEAVREGPLIARYTGRGRKPHLDGQWLEVDVGTLVIATQLTPSGKIEALVFRQWRLGYGGVRVDFDPESLEVVY